MKINAWTRVRLGIRDWGLGAGGLGANCLLLTVNC